MRIDRLAPILMPLSGQPRRATRARNTSPTPPPAHADPTSATHALRNGSTSDTDNPSECPHSGHRGEASPRRLYPHSGQGASRMLSQSTSAASSDGVVVGDKIKSPMKRILAYPPRSGA